MVHEMLSLGQAQFVVWTFRYIAVFQDRGECASVARVFIAYALSFSFSLSLLLSLSSLYRRWFILLHFLKNFLKMFLTFSLFFVFFFYSETGST